MKTPICDFCEKYAKLSSVRLHMPAHKGKGLMQSLDITEIDGADSLYECDGIIRESEHNASILFGTRLTHYSTEGSSQVIRAMLYLAKVYSQSEKPYILSMRNSHKTFVNACALLDIDIEWLYGSELLTCNVTADEVDNFLKAKAQRPIAVYLTSPDYLGNIVDIGNISKVCKKYGVLLIVDNAHGAYLKFLQPSQHPIDLGADMCCDSAHKTLFALTGASYLHISHTAPQNLDDAKNALALFGSTSPSYLILQSLDGLNSIISNQLNEFVATEKAVLALKNELTKNGYTLLGSEPFKITLSCKKYGYTGREIYNYLKSNNVVCEYYDDDYLVMMFSNATESAEFEKVKNLLISLKKQDEVVSKMPKIERFDKVLTPNQAFSKRKKLIEVSCAENKILAGASVSCPPAVLVVSIGERITKCAIEIMKYYNINKCLVIDE